MISQIQRQKLCDLILEIGKLEKKIEVVRQLLCEYPEFTPYSAFKRIDIRQVNEISSYDIRHFVQENNSTISITQCELFIKLFDKDGDKNLSYDEFLDAILPQDNPRLRQKVLQKEPIALLPGERLESEIEYTIIKLIDWESKGVQELEQEKYEFLGKGVNNISKFLQDCFYLIDVEKKGFFNDKQLESFFLHNSKVIFPEETQAFFRRLTYNCSTEVIQENDFIIGIDFAPYNRDRQSQTRARIQAPLLSFGINNIQQQNSLQQNQSIKTANFGQKTNVEGRSRIYSQDRQSFDNNLNHTTPTKTPIKGYYTQDFSSRGLRSNSNSNYKTQPNSKLRSSSITTPSQIKNNESNVGYDVLTYSTSSYKQNPYSVQPAATTSVKVIKPLEKDLGKVRVKEELERQHLMKKLAITNKPNSKVDQIATNSARIVSGKKVAKFALSNAETVDSFYQPSATYSGSKQNSSNLKQKKTTPLKQRQETSPNYQKSPIQKNSTSSMRKQKTEILENEDLEAKQIDQKQTLLQFKQDVRCKLATSKLNYERSLSPVKQINPNNINSKQNIINICLNNNSSIRNSSRNGRNGSGSKLSQSYILIENEPIRKSPEKKVPKNKKSNTQTSNNSILLSNNPQRNEEYIENSISYLKKSTLKKQQSSPNSNNSLSLSNQGEKDLYTRLNPSAATKTPQRSLKANISYHINSYLMAIINNNKNLEKIKQDLALKADFNLYDAFRLIDWQERGVITAYNIEMFLSSHKISATINEIILLIKRFDFLKHGALRFSDFSCALLSNQGEYKSLVERRQGSDIQQENIKHVFSRETMKLYTKLIVEYLSCEYQLEAIRQSISQDKRWDYEYCFDMINESQTGLITGLELKHFLEYQNYLPNERDISSILERFDKDEDNAISISEFVSEISPRSSA
ncbi:EF hand protein (macronuclear) [Tetrahymena thermophila SB210]|uniref:EF hand protein n=1 Tax=Tetrahymena thermophila (strain SB210) TaxID=312017 RepID=I7MJ96_TETTS|nr:EF hand protein [Tetrahymena thermophila SB210]EAS06012.2 EF hand protein [Tetrahymena thermophila SB210]|eukprot:XP_001026257.2 EF hand protein [Tetrahymena thermophila SB210]